MCQKWAFRLGYVQRHFIPSPTNVLMVGVSSDPGISMDTVGVGVTDEVFGPGGTPLVARATAKVGDALVSVGSVSCVYK